MRVSFDSASLTTSPSSGPQARTAPQGLANTPSSLEFRLMANESGGLCAWLQNIVKQFCQFFSRLFSSNPVPPRTAEHLLEERVAVAERIIANHFRHTPIVSAPENSVLITAMKYQGHSDITYELKRNPGPDLVTKNAMARQLLTRAPHAENDNGYLEISTYLLTKNPPNMFSVDSKRRFSEITQEDDGSMRAPLSLRALISYLSPFARSIEQAREIDTFLSRWQSSP